MHIAYTMYYYSIISLLYEKSIEVFKTNKITHFFTGSMQDYNYAWHGCMEITLEMSCCKYPPASFLESHWKDHLKVLYIQLLQNYIY